MMNLELLYFATKVTGDSCFANVANKHAETTIKNQFREDYSNYHVVNYDEETGEVLHRLLARDSRTIRLGRVGRHGPSMAIRWLIVRLKDRIFWIWQFVLPISG